MTDGTDRVVLPSTSLAQDAAYRGMADVAAAWRDRVDDYRVVGGHMVSVHVARFPVDVPVRGTLDTDVGMEARLLATGDPVQELRALGYTLVEGNRMSRSVNGHDAVIDILIPATGTRARHNRKVGDLFVDEAPRSGSRQHVRPTSRSSRCGSRPARCSSTSPLSLTWSLQSV